MIRCEDVAALRLLGRPLTGDAPAHVAGCARCRAEEPALAAVSALLAAAPAAVPPLGLSARVMAAAEPLLARHVARTARRRLVWALVAGLLPLPAIVLLDAWLVRSAYDLLTRFLPDVLSLWVVANWVGLLALLFALTYGAIPVLAARQTATLRPRGA